MNFPGINLQCVCLPLTNAHLQGVQMALTPCRASSPPMSQGVKSGRRDGPSLGLGDRWSSGVH